MCLVGFTQKSDGTVLEYLPKNEQMKNLHQRRGLFFSLYNFYVEKDLQFTKEEYIGFKDIKSVFETKINALLKSTYHDKKSKYFKIDIPSTKIINAYHDKRAILVNQAPKLQVAKLINLIYSEGSPSLMLNLDDMFLTLVYERIKKINHSCEVVMGEKEIYMIDPNPDVSPTLIIPFYKNITHESMREDSLVTSNITLAKNHLKANKIRQIFLIFPKSESFSKHLDLKFHGGVALHEDEYRVKMIPYSFSFCIKNQSKSSRQQPKI